MKVKDVLNIIQENKRRLDEISSNYVYYDERYQNDEEVDEARVKVARLKEEYDAWLETEVN
jgi:hypothetical protein